MSGGRVTLDRVKSWEYDDIDNKFAIKDLDKSSFKRGSHIPIKVRKVFECEDIKYGDKKKITLIYKGEAFEAEIEGEIKGRIRMNWPKLIPKMKEVFKNEINDFEDSKELSVRVPRLKFTKETAIKYNVEMKTKYSHDVLCELERLEIDIENKTIEEINEVGEVIISKRLSEKEQELLNINKDIVINLEEGNKKFLKDHRYVFYDIEKEYVLEKELEISNKEIEVYSIELDVE